MPSQCQLLNSWNSGVRIATPGNIEAPRITVRTNPLPRKDSRASAYAAKTPITMDTAVTTAPMRRLFSSERAKGLYSASNAYRKLSRVTWLNHRSVAKVCSLSRKASTSIQ